jgi:hypothetical protein
MPSPAFYLGSTATPDFGSIFGGSGTGGTNASFRGGNPPRGSDPPPPTGGPFTPGAPPSISGWGQPSSVDTTKNNVVGAQGVRAEGPSRGFDPQYLQNLATSDAGNFARPAGANAVSFNPLGNLADITKLLMSFGSPSPTLGFGNAPLPGLPQNLLQWAQAFNPTALTPPAPVSNTGGDYGSNVNNTGPRRGS